MNDVQIFEVSPRDGLQNEATFVATEDKVAHIERLVAAGVKDIEVTSFVRPRWIPALADAEAVVERLPMVEGVRYWGLVPNQRGFDRARSSGISNICTFLSSSETHNAKNVNRTINESVSAVSRVIRSAADEGLGVRAYISTVFGCPYEGDVSVEAPLRIAQSMLDAGADVVVLGDTTGMALPEQVRRVIGRFADAGVDLGRVALHAHDTRGTALVNVFAAYQAGIRRFDGSAGGIGGCPYAPGASGNAATEDLVYLFHGLGLSTGVGLDELAAAATEMEALLGRALPGRFLAWWKGQRNSDAKCESA
ncbi:MAG: hydroxymethylglutaryl-CoA lyase [Myxococcota bacterium]